MFFKDIWSRHLGSFVRRLKFCGYLSFGFIAAVVSHCIGSVCQVGQNLALKHVSGPVPRSQTGLKLDSMVPSTDKYAKRVAMIGRQCPRSQRHAD